MGIDSRYAPEWEMDALAPLTNIQTPDWEMNDPDVLFAVNGSRDAALSLF